MRSLRIVLTSVAILLLAARPGLAQTGSPAGAGSSVEAMYRAIADSLIHAATGDSAAYARLHSPGIWRQMPRFHAHEIAIDLRFLGCPHARSIPTDLLCINVRDVELPY